MLVVGVKPAIEQVLLVLPGAVLTHRVNPRTQEGHLAVLVVIITLFGCASLLQLIGEIVDLISQLGDLMAEVNLNLWSVVIANGS